ncbi:MAG TPA: mechanosensitive ion channel family protein, partial [Ignavibacteriaceae bacterium]|nr:mechanosensitive ion channel family protein [Ignavibacteriaceae bacterium]
MKKRSKTLFKIVVFIFLFLLNNSTLASIDTTSSPIIHSVPVVISHDTLFYINANIGPFTSQQRVDAIEKRLSEIIKSDLNPDSIGIREVSGLTNIELDSIIIMSLSSEDVKNTGKTEKELGLEYVSIIKKVLKKNIEIYSTKNLLMSFGFSLLFLLIAILLFWLMKIIFPKGYLKLEKWEKSFFIPIKFRGEEILSVQGISSFIIIILKLIRLTLTLVVIYYLILNIFSLFPWTKGWEIKSLLKGISITIIFSAAAYVVYKSLNTFLNILHKKTDNWRGTVIKSVKVRDLEILSDERILDSIKFIIKVIRFVFILIFAYFYFTLLFSFFSFTRTWASTLIYYILKPLGSIVFSFINFLPSLFAILVILFVTRYIIKFFKIIFNEIGKGSVAFRQFPVEWSEPTYKIVRFFIIIFAAILVFPYLPGSNSEAFKGITVFLGIVFSFGSSSAISNIVSGTVLTYMRPFRLGDRVKIADTVGDVIEKTLLVTRIRTIKNVDITIPNSMVLGSHIVNYSTTAKEKGLILNTSVTIGYDAPWKKIHELLISAALSTKDLLTEPKPFILQTALSDFYVVYEINAYTDKPNSMANIYSDLHQNIQDKFNEAGIEIMSPHYTGVRDGNAIKIPDEYIQRDYNP